MSAYELGTYTPPAKMSQAGIADSLTQVSECVNPKIIDAADQYMIADIMSGILSNMH